MGHRKWATDILLLRDRGKSREGTEVKGSNLMADIRIFFLKTQEIYEGKFVHLEINKIPNILNLILLMMCI